MIREWLVPYHSRYTNSVRRHEEKMKINKHIERIKDRMILALSSDKKILLDEFSTVLQDCTELLNTNKLDFWNIQLANNDWNQIPTTKISVSNELHNWRNYTPTLRTIIDQLQGTSERILVYWIKDDLCEMQGQFFHYLEENSNQIYKESEFGNIQGLKREKYESSLALIPDLLKSKLVKREILNEMYQ